MAEYFLDSIIISHVGTLIKAVNRYSKDLHFSWNKETRKHKKIPPVVLYVWFLDPELQEKSSGANLQRHPFLGSDDVSLLDQSYGTGLRQELSIHVSK
jgi:hypothetical protein